VAGVVVISGVDLTDVVGGVRGQWLVAALLISVFVKGHFVIADFMGLRGVAMRWRLLVHGWLVLVIGLIFLAYWIGV
jgi:hypothetical protein